MQLLRCTLQITIGMLLLFVAASCADDKAVPKSGAAGLVIAVQGEVSATRPSEARRMLKKSDTVFNDDTIVTGPNSSLEVELAHNGARWQLSADNERRVDSSLAWRAQRQTVAALDPDEHVGTGSAGRNSTREAAESRETLMAERPEPVMVPEDPGASAPDSLPERPARRHLGSQSTRRGKPRSDRPMEKPSPLGAPGNGVRAPAPPPQTQPTPVTVTRAAEEATSNDAEGGGAEQESKTTEADEVPAALRAHVLTLARRCHAKHGGRGKLSVALTARAGKAGNLRVSGPDTLEATRSCVEAALRTGVLPEGGPLSLTIPLP